MDTIEIKKNMSPERPLIVFPAFQLGLSELFYFLKSMEDSDLLDTILLICEEEIFDLLQMTVPHHIIDDSNSIPLLIAKLETWSVAHKQKFTGIIGIDEEEQFQISMTIARHFGLELFKERTCLISSNKFLMKSSFREHGVPTGDFSLVSSIDDPRVSSMSFPNVLKVVSGNGSQFVFFNENMTELSHNFEVLIVAMHDTGADSRFIKRSVKVNGRQIMLDPRRQFLLEAFVPGDEYSCDFIIHHGEIQIIRIVKKIPGPYFGYFLGFQLMSREDVHNDGFTIQDLETICERIADSLDVNSGVCMVDFKKDNGLFSVLESSVRPGFSAFNHLMYALFGYTSLTLLAKLQLSVPLSFAFPDENGAVVYLYAKPEENILTINTAELEKLRDQYSILDIHTYEDELEIEKNTETDHTTLLRGYVLLKNSDEKKLPELFTLFNDAVRSAR